MLLRQGPVCTWLLKPNGAFQAVYGNALAQFGRARADLEGLNFADLFAPRTRDSWMSRIDRVFTGRTVSAAGRFGEGAPTFCITLFPVRLAAGAVAFAGGISHETPERDAALRALRALEADRDRLYQMLHDQVGQHLSAAGLQLDLLRMDLAESDFPIAERTSEIQTMLETIMVSVRNFNHEMNPVSADRVG